MKERTTHKTYVDISSPVWDVIIAKAVFESKCDDMKPNRPLVRPTPPLSWSFAFLAWDTRGWPTALGSDVL